MQETQCFTAIALINLNVGRILLHVDNPVEREASDPGISAEVFVAAEECNASPVRKPPEFAKSHRILEWQQGRGHKARSRQSEAGRDDPKNRGYHAPKGNPEKGRKVCSLSKVILDRLESNCTL